MHLLLISVLCECSAGGYVNSSSLGSGYEYGYGGGAMKNAGYAAKATGPYGGVKSVLAVLQTIHMCLTFFNAIAGQASSGCSLLM